MSGVTVVGNVLRGFEDLTAIVPVSAIKALIVPANTAPPAIAVKRISRSEQQMLSRQSRRQVHERVQVTVEAADYRSLGAILKLVVSACADRTIAASDDLTNIAILSAGGGPDFLDEAGSLFMGSHDFYVDFNEPA